MRERGPSPATTGSRGVAGCVEPHVFRRSTGARSAKLGRRARRVARPRSQQSGTIHKEHRDVDRASNGQEHRCRQSVVGPSPSRLCRLPDHEQRERLRRAAHACRAAHASAILRARRQDLAPRLRRRCRRRRLARDVVRRQTQQQHDDRRCRRLCGRACGQRLCAVQASAISERRAAHRGHDRGRAGGERASLESDRDQRGGDRRRPQTSCAGQCGLSQQGHLDASRPGAIWPV